MILNFDSPIMWYMRPSRKTDAIEIKMYLFG